MKIRRYIALARRLCKGPCFPWSGVINYGKHLIGRREVNVSPTGLAPLMATFMITKRCNLKCSFCIIGKKIASGGPSWETLEMDAGFVSSVLERDFLGRILTVVLAGGEPLLNTSIFDIIRTVKRKNKICGLITNGLLLLDHLPELLEAGIDDIQVSVYDQSIEKLRQTLPEICKKIPMHASYVLLRSVVEKNPGQIDHIVKSCGAAGFVDLKINICVPYDGNTEETIYSDCTAYTRYVSESKKRHKGFTVFFPSPVSRESPLTGQNCRCWIPWQAVTIDALGDFTMCCGYFTPDVFAGNIFASNDQNSYNNRMLRDLRAGLLGLEKTEAFETRCVNCPHLTGSFASRL